MDQTRPCGSRAATGSNACCDFTLNFGPWTLDFGLLLSALPPRLLLLRLAVAVLRGDALAEADHQVAIFDFRPDGRPVGEALRQGHVALVVPYPYDQLVGMLIELHVAVLDEGQLHAQLVGALVLGEPVRRLVEIDVGGVPAAVKDFGEAVEAS